MTDADRGSATVVAALLVALVLVALVGLGSLTVLYGVRAEANNAADAAALAAAVATYPPAGAGDPRAEAARYAAANGAAVVSCDCPIDSGLGVRSATVIVEKEVTVPFFGTLEVRAAATGEFDPVAWLGG
ncbi:MAG: pilus assembly protein TadG-related protein [Acidimicrobiia bacterium]